MELIAIVAVATAVLLAINVGGNNSATEMGPAFGSGMRTKGEAVILIAIFSVFGAVMAGGHVVNTIASGLMPAEVLQQHIGAVIIILLAATAMIGVANGLRIPVATSHAMVGAVVGMGLFHGTVHWANLGRIVIWWLATPLLSLVLSYLLGRYVYDHLNRFVNARTTAHTSHRMYRLFVTVSGCFMAFSAGSNSLAKAVGPVVGAGILTTEQAGLIGGLSMAIGALVVGHRLLHTVGKGITPLDPLKATLVEIVCGTMLLTASIAGVPVSLAEIITCSVIGFGAAHSGILLTTQNRHVRLMYSLWPVCPLITCALSYGMATLVALVAGR